MQTRLTGWLLGKTYSERGTTTTATLVATTSSRARSSSNFSSKITRSGQEASASRSTTRVVDRSY